MQLQTNFGGGKTHSMLALYHLCSGRPVTEYPQEVQEVLAGQELAKLGDIRRVTLVGTHLMPGKPSLKDDGPKSAPYGARWLGSFGRAGRRMNSWPQPTVLAQTQARRLLISFGRSSPGLILIDEWVAYARGFYGKEDLPGGTFDTQFTLPKH